MCSTLLFESIQYFVKIESTGYVLFIDTSKVFDRVCHSHISNTLEERRACPLITRLLFITCLYPVVWHLPSKRVMVIA